MLHRVPGDAGAGIVHRRHLHIGHRLGGCGGGKGGCGAAVAGGGGAGDAGAAATVVADGMGADRADAPRAQTAARGRVGDVGAPLAGSRQGLPVEDPDPAIQLAALGEGHRQRLPRCAVRGQRQAEPCEIARHCRHRHRAARLRAVRQAQAVPQPAGSGREVLPEKSEAPRRLDSARTLHRITVDADRPRPALGRIRIIQVALIENRVLPYRRIPRLELGRVVHLHPDSAQAPVRVVTAVGRVGQRQRAVEMEGRLVHAGHRHLLGCLVVRCREGKCCWACGRGPGITARRADGDGGVTARWWSGQPHTIGRLAGLEDAKSGFTEDAVLRRACHHRRRLVVLQRQGRRVVRGMRRHAAAHRRVRQAERGQRRGDRLVGRVRVVAVRHRGQRHRRRLHRVGVVAGEDHPRVGRQCVRQRHAGVHARRRGRDREVVIGGAAVRAPRQPRPGGRRQRDRHADGLAAIEPAIQRDCQHRRVRGVALGHGHVRTRERDRGVLVVLDEDLVRGVVSRCRVAVEGRRAAHRVRRHCPDDDGAVRVVGGRVGPVDRVGA